jgi:hypothetical protein
MIFAADQIDEIVGAEMPFLPQEHVDDLFPLAGTLPAFGLESADVWKGGCRHVGQRSRSMVKGGQRYL